MSDQITIVPHVKGVGGMVSFLAKFTKGLDARGIAHTFNLDDPASSAVLVIGGTRDLRRLNQACKRGCRIVQRLNGMNWMHRKMKTSLRYWLRAEAANRLLAHIRRSVTSRIIYQSQFSCDWWMREFGDVKKPNRVVYNGIDLNTYKPDPNIKPPTDHFNLLIVEGNLQGEYARGLETCVKMAKLLHESHHLPLELTVVGDVPETMRQRAHHLAPDLPITWRGVVQRHEIIALDQSAHLLFSSDLNAACPNSVIEALACGLPVLSYDTGALAELVQGGAGEVVPYGSDYWKLQPPCVDNLVEGALKILKNNTSYRANARLRAEAHFGLDKMMTDYLEVLLG